MADSPMGPKQIGGGAGLLGMDIILIARELAKNWDCSENATTEHRVRADGNPLYPLLRGQVVLHEQLLQPRLIFSTISFLYYKVSRFSKC